MALFGYDWRVCRKGNLFRASVSFLFGVEGNVEIVQDESASSGRGGVCRADRGRVCVELPSCAESRRIR